MFSHSIPKRIAKRWVETGDSPHIIIIKSWIIPIVQADNKKAAYILEKKYFLGRKSDTAQKTLYNRYCTD
jgi:hypothetical protein